MKKSTLIYVCTNILLFLNQSCSKETSLKNKQISALSEDDLNDSRINDSTLLCYFPFNGNLKDKSGHNNNGALVGTVSYTTDRFGNALKAASFSASNSYIEIPETQFVGLTNMTISMDFFCNITWKAAFT